MTEQGSDYPGHCEVEVVPSEEHLLQPEEDRPKFICGQLLVDGKCPEHG